MCTHLVFVLQENTKTTWIYDRDRKCILGHIDTLRSVDFEKYMHKHFKEVSRAEIPFNYIIRQVLYKLYPDIIIGISKETMESFLLGHNFYKIGLHEDEVAATRDEPYEVGHLLFRGFIESFYCAETGEDALNHYGLLQINIPMQPKLYRYIRTIEFFIKEIMIGYKWHKEKL